MQPRIGKNSTTTNEPVPAHFKISIGDKSAMLSYQKVFAIGFYLWKKQKFSESATVFQKISSATDRGPRAHIFLAHNLAMLGKFDECAAVLNRALPKSEFSDADSDLHYAFVSWKCGLYCEVRTHLERIAEYHPELPSVCLMLAEFLRFVGNRNKPEIWLRAAISRDRRRGAIAVIAQDCLSRLTSHAT